MKKSSGISLIPKRDDRIAGVEPAPVFEDEDPYWRIGVTALHRMADLGPLSYVSRRARTYAVHYTPFEDDARRGGPLTLSWKR